MSIRPSARNLFPPLDNPELTIRRRSHSDPTLLNNYEMVAEGNGDLPVPDLRTIEELCQPSLNGRGVPIAWIAIQAMNFGLKNDMIQQVQNSCQFHGLPGTLTKIGDFISELYDHGRRKICPEKHFGLCSKVLIEFLGRRSNQAVPPLATLKNVYAAGAYQGNTITNPKEDLKGITTRSRTAYQGPTIPTTSSSPVVERETEATNDTVHLTNNGTTKDVQPPVVPTKSPTLNSELVNSLIIEPVASPVSAPKPNQRPSIPYPSRLHDQKLRDKANDQREKFFQIFKDLNFNISFVDALILMPKRSFLKTGRALIDVFEGELTLRVGKEAITFNLDQTSRYSANYNDMTTNRIDVIDMACEDYSQEVLGFFDVIASGSPTPYYDPIVSTTSLTLTPFKNSDFLLREGDILLLEAFLNDNPSLPPPNQGNYLPKVRKELKICEAKSNKSSIDEPLEVELKDLPPHLEYAFLEGDDKLPVVIAKDLSVEEKATLITVLKSHKRAIAWKLSDIKGIDPEFCTHKILMEEDFKPAAQHQRRVNPKIHDVIKQDVLKLLDA
nr:reverse transcriptase domain-containing protein [Tanacetum cinerariifolium]